MITINIYYTGESQSASKFAKEMIDSGLVEKIRKEDGNLRYEYFYPLEESDTVLLIDSWQDQGALDKHHESNLMKEISKLRDKYNLHMKVERYVLEDGGVLNKDKKYIRQ